MTYGEVVSQIKTYLNKGVASDDARISGRFIMSVFLRKRARIIKQEQEKKRLKNKFSLQRISCMELIDVEKHECECLPMRVTCSKVKRTKNALPSPVGNTLYNITSIDGSMVISPTEFFDYSIYDRLVPLRSKPKYFVANDFIYVTNTDLTFISVEAIFENPEEVSKAGCASENDDVACFYALTQDVNTDPDILDATMTLAAQEILTMLRYTQEDKYNDTSATEVDYTKLQAQLNAAKKESNNS